jgi:hypothetical protein
MIIYNNFLGGDLSNVTLDFVGGDSKQQFNKNVLTQPSDWYYNDRKLTYSYNSQGHRCKNFEDIDQDNYILVTGCSHTMGVGLELEKTYPYIVSKELGVDYYNLAIPATGIDVVEYNLLTWFFTVIKKPKLVLVQWPDHSRYIKYDFKIKRGLERGSWQSAPDQMSFIVNSEDTGMFYARKYMTYNLIKTCSPSPLIPFNFGGQQDYGIYDLHMPKLDQARDLSHAGIKSHEEFTKTLLNHIEVNGLIK